MLHRGIQTMPGMGWFDIIAGFFWIVSVVFLFVVLLRIARRGHNVIQVGSERQSPMDIIRERYAKGELTKEQFTNMKKELAEK